MSKENVSENLGLPQFGVDRPGHVGLRPTAGRGINFYPDDSTPSEEKSSPFTPSTEEAPSVDWKTYFNDNPVKEVDDAADAEDTADRFKD